jgi:hypothetical protein
MSQFRLTEATFDQGKSSEFTSFVAIHVKGVSTNGTQFEGDVFLDMDGRDADWEGTDFGEDLYPELFEPLFDSIYVEEFREKFNGALLDEAYKQAQAWWEAQASDDNLEPK